MIANEGTIDQKPYDVDVINYRSLYGQWENTVPHNENLNTRHDNIKTM